VTSKNDNYLTITDKVRRPSEKIYTEKKKHRKVDRDIRYVLTARQRKQKRLLS
jgi:hypothetical protein